MCSILDDIKTSLKYLLFVSKERKLVCFFISILTYASIIYQNSIPLHPIIHSFEDSIMRCEFDFITSIYLWVSSSEKPNTSFIE